jgi:hypothetical protein
VLAAAEAVQAAVSEVSRALRSAKTDTAATEVAAHVVASGMGIGVVPCAVVLGRPSSFVSSPSPLRTTGGSSFITKVSARWRVCGARWKRWPRCSKSSVRSSRALRTLFDGQ